jgi:uncharacterized membrane protein HdeD (DUF308 family)
MAGQTGTAPQHSVYALGGIVAILFGLIAVLWPHVTLALLVIFFGAFAIGHGVMSLIDMFNHMGRHETWWPSLIIGIISIVAGFYVLTNLTVSAIILALVIAVWALFVGVIEIVAAISTGQLLMLVVGVLTVVFGLILLGHPHDGALALVFIIGAFAIVRGILMLLIAFRSPRTPATSS